ncbi:hypothetical protein AB0A76_09010 [Streptomyces exfoliatus]|uniref:Uncharacterized protein n=1 Tax=Streptomyces exfoliatus TaxID=1905 RepID=A0ABV3CUY8_STREX
MAERLTFTLEGRDQLSRVLGHAGESADRLRQSMEDAADGSGQALLTLTQDADGRLRDMEGRFLSAADAAALMATRTDDLARPTTTWSEAADKAGVAGEAFKKSLISLAPAAIPAAASLAPIAPAVLAGAAAAGVFALALGKQMSAMSDAAKAEEKYAVAVEESGATSEAAIKAQAAYAKQMAQLPPATRQAAAALSVFKEEYQEWSDSLATDTMTPVVHGLAAMQGILPKLTPMVKGFAGELDRTVTLAAGGVASPGFDAFAQRMGEFSTGVMEDANDGLVTFLRTLDTDAVGQGVGEFLAWAREQGPVVGDIMRNLAGTLINMLEASSDLGVSMLQIVGVLSELAAAVPPEMISTLLQLAIAIKVVNLAAAGGLAARTAIAALGTQLVTMRTAAAAAPGPLAAAGAAIGTLSRTAKLAIAGTGIGLLIIALSELSAGAEQAPPDVDKLTGSLKQLGATGKTTGEAARAFGSDLGGLYDKVRSLTDPSTTDQVQQFIVSFGGLATWDSTPVKQAKENLDAIDKALASLVSSGNSDLAAAAARRLSEEYIKGGGTAEEFTGELDDYDTALQNSRFEQELAADAMGLYGRQAQETKAKLDAQKQSADGLRQALFALSNVNRDATGAMSDYEAAVDAATKAAEDNGRSLRMVNGVLDLNSDKARANDAALRDLAAKTEAAAASAREQGKSNEYVNGVLDKGKKQLVDHAGKMGLDKSAADALARSYLAIPERTIRTRGNIEDLRAKLDSAKSLLKKVPDSRKAAVRANISQLEAEVARAERLLSGIPDERVGVGIYLQATSWDQDANGVPDAIQGRASGGMVGFPGGGAVRGPGTSTSDSILTRLSNGEYVVRAAAVVKYGQPFLDAVNQGRLDVASAVPAGVAARAPQPGRAAGATSQVAVNNYHFTVQGAVDPVSTAKQIRTLLLKDKRTNGGKGLGIG